MMKHKYAIIITDKTRLDLLIERFNTINQAKFYIENSGGEFKEYVEEDKIYKNNLTELQINLSKHIKNKTIDREFVSSYIFAADNIVVVYGRDGLVANVAKYSKGLPIVAVNPDPQRIDGVLLPFDVYDFAAGVKNVLKSNYESTKLNFAEAILNNGERMLAFNDLFIGCKSHASARYKIKFKDKSENHSSSGVIVSTSAGATGWAKSVFNMVNGIAKMVGVSNNITCPAIKNNNLLFMVREPYDSVNTEAKICAGFIKGKSKVTIESLMPKDGVIFSDGVQNDFLNFNSGSSVTIARSKKYANLVL